MLRNDHSTQSAVGTLAFSCRDFIGVLLLSLFYGCVLVAPAGAVTISTTLIPKTGSDANSDITSSHTYTHAIDLAADSSLSLNGVQFTPTGGGLSVSDVNYGGTLTQTLSSGLTGLGTLSNGSIQADGVSGQIIDTFTYSLGQVQGSVRTFEFGGLTAGNRYRANFYGFDWDDALNIRRVDVRSTDPYSAGRKLVDWADPTSTGSPTDHQAFYISIDYVAISSSQIFTMGALTNDSAHVGAITNYVLEENVIMDGDVNLNDVVNLSDFDILGGNMLATGVGYAGGDINGDGVVDMSDYRKFKDSPYRVDGYDTLAAEAVGVPEPATFALIVGALVLTLSNRSCVRQ